MLCTMCLEKKRKRVEEFFLCTESLFLFCFCWNNRCVSASNWHVNVFILFFKLGRDVAARAGFPYDILTLSCSDFVLGGQREGDVEAKGYRPSSNLQKSLNLCNAFFFFKVTGSVRRSLPLTLKMDLTFCCCSVWGGGVGAGDHVQLVF